MLVLRLEHYQKAPRFDDEKESFQLMVTCHIQAYDHIPDIKHKHSKSDQ